MIKSQSLYMTSSQYITYMKVRFGISIEKEAVDALDEAIAQKGRFANRSQAIEYCVRQVLAMEKHEKQSMELLLDFIDLIERRPEIGEKFRDFMKEEMKK